MATTTDPVTLKDQTVIPAKTKVVDWCPSNSSAGLIRLETGNVVRIRNAFRSKAPKSMKTLEKWAENGVAKSVLGKRVEPDGYDDEGSPSWLLVFGLI